MHTLLKSFALVVGALAAFVAPVRAESVHDVLTGTGSGISISVSTPLKFAPHFGFLPLRVSVTNKSSKDGTWMINVVSGDASVFPGLARASFSVSVPAGGTKESWFYAPLLAPGIVATPTFDPNAPPPPPVIFAPAATQAPPEPVLNPGRGGTFGGLAANRGAVPAQGMVPPPAADKPAAVPQGNALEREATEVLGPTKLLDTPWGVTESVSNANGVVTFEQTGSALALIKPPAASLPKGVIVNLHSAPEPGQVVRTVTYVAADTLAALDAQATSRADAYRKALARNTMSLWRFGYLRRSAAVQSTLPNSFADTDGVVTTTVLESGPATILTQPPPEALPPNTLVTVTPGAVPPGGVIRRFTVTALVPSVASDPQNARPFSSVLGAADPGLILAQVSGPGIDRPVWTDMSSGLDSEIQPMPPIAVPQRLEDSVRGRLALGNLRAPPTVTPIDAAALPADWRVWSSIHGVLLGSTDYEKLDPERKAALRRWVALGGRVVLSTDTDEGGGVERIGAGEITTMNGQLDYVAPSKISRELQLPTPVLGLPERIALGRDNASVKTLGSGETSDTRWLIYVLIGFAIIAGPVNLFIFAPSGKRHRIVLTMPAIALAGAVVMGGGVVARVGLGGEGIRSSVVALLPDEGGAAVFQDQVSRTGVIMSGKFDLPDDAVMAAAPLDAGGTQSNETVLTRDAGAADGDWFRSREFQAYHLRRFVPATGKVELSGAGANGAPTITSSLKTALTDFSWIDDNDKVWTAGSIGPGQTVTLSVATDQAWPRLKTKDSRAIEEIFEAVSARMPGRWVARSGASDIAPIPTLAAIRWKDNDVLITGVAASKSWAPRPAERIE